MNVKLADLDKVWKALSDINLKGDDSCYAWPPYDYRLILAKVKKVVVRRMQNGARIELSRCDNAFEYALAALQHQGYVTLSYLDMFSDLVLSFTDKADRVLAGGEGPVFRESDLGVNVNRPGRRTPDTGYLLILSPRKAPETQSGSPLEERARNEG